MGNLGNAYADLGETHRAIELLEQYLTEAREIGDRRGQGNALSFLGIAYKKTSLPIASDGVYVAKVEKPASGWTAFFVELVYDSGASAPYKFTTQVSIVPDTLPHSISELKKGSK